MAEPTKEQIDTLMRMVMERGLQGRELTAADLMRVLGCSLPQAVGVISAVRLASPAGLDELRSEVHTLNRELPARLSRTPGNC